jgi:aminopeptidase N
MRSKLKDVLQTTHTTDGGYYAVYGIPQTITYGSTVYQKGGQVAHTLRGYLGDSIFFDGIKAYLSKYAYNYASTYDLRDFLSEYSGIDLKPFFDAWVFTPGFPHFSIDSVLTKKSSSGYDVTVIVRQRLKGKTQYADANHLEITFMDSNWHKVTDTIQFSGKGGRKVFHLPFAPVAAMADMDEKISDATTDMAQILTKPGEYDFPQTFVRVGVSQISDSALVRITHNWVAPDSENLIPKKCRISDSHYWTVEGIFSSGFKASGKFSYEKTSGLDKSLLSSPNDSLVILYRPGAGHKWIFSDCKRDGSYANGTITVEVLQPGEYAFAVLSKQ